MGSDADLRVPELARTNLRPAAYEMMGPLLSFDPHSVTRPTTSPQVSLMSVPLPWTTATPLDQSQLISGLPCAISPLAPLPTSSPNPSPPPTAAPLILQGGKVSRWAGGRGRAAALLKGQLLRGSETPEQE